MQTFVRPLTAVALIAASTISAAASQGPGTSTGTATGLAQSLFFGAVIAAACIGLAFRLKRH